MCYFSVVELQELFVYLTYMYIYNEGDTGDKGSNRGSIRSPGERNGRGDWQATVHRVAMSQTGLKQLSMHARTLPAYCKRLPRH